MNSVKKLTVKIILVIIVIIILVWLITRFTLAPEYRGSWWMPTNSVTREVHNDDDLSRIFEEPSTQPGPIVEQNEELPDSNGVKGYFTSTERVSSMDEINFNNQNIDLGSGSIFAVNLFYSIHPGAGISISDGQNPTITNIGVLSLAGQSGNIDLVGGNGISVEGLNIANLGVLSIAGQTGDIDLEEGSDIEIDGLKIGLRSTLNNVSQINLPNSSNPIAIGGISLGRSGISLLWNGNTLIDSGNINTLLVGLVNGTANQITASNPTGTVTLSIPTDFIAPGTVNAVSGLYTGAEAGAQRIDAAGNLVNVGTISSTWLTASTHIVNIAGASTAFQMNGVETITSGRLIGLADGSAASPAYSFTDNNNMGMFRAANNQLGFSVGGIERIRVNAFGDIGIGTDAPTQKLEVVGNIQIDENSAFMQGGQQALSLAFGADSHFANTYVGAGAGSGMSRQSALGYFAGYQNAGDRQSVFGYLAGYQNSGDHQSVFGYLAGYQNSGDHQSATGYLSGYQNTGDYQSVFGYLAGHQNTGDYQSALGYFAGRENNGNRVTAIGFEAARGNTGSDVLALGYKAGLNNAIANQFIVQQANVNPTPLIQGNFSSGNVGIGTTNPNNFRLQVSGNVGPQTDNTSVLGSSGVRWANVFGVLGEFSTSAATPLVTNAGNLTLAATGSNSVMLQTNGNTRWSVLSGGILESTEAQTIRTSTGNLTLATNAGNGDIILSPHGNGNIGIGTTSPGSRLLIKGSGATSATSALNVTNSADTSALFVRNDGNIGIGTTDPATHRLSVVGTAGLSTGTAWTNTSDERLKDVEDELTGSSLEKLMQLRPVSFRWNALHNEQYKSTNEKLNLGFIAQEVEGVFPSLITTDEKGYKWYNPSGFEAVLTAAIQEQQQQIVDIKERVAVLENTNGEPFSLTTNPTVSFENQELYEMLSISTDEDGRKQLAIFGDLNVVGYAVVDSLTALSSINIGLLTINGDDDSINVLGGELRLQNAYGAGNIDIFNGNVVVTPEGNIEASGIIQAGKVKADELESVSAEIDVVKVSGGITMVDQVTGEYYCVVVVEGELVSTNGVCEEGSAIIDD